MKEYAEGKKLNYMRIVLFTKKTAIRFKERMESEIEGLLPDLKKTVK